MIEEENSTTPSINENSRIEGLYDVICSEIGFEDNTKDLRDNIRLFGKLRFNQGRLDTLKEVREKIEHHCKVDKELGRLIESHELLKQLED